MTANQEQSMPLLTTETLLKDRWEPLRKIGGGGFGEIYQANDRESNTVSTLCVCTYVVERRNYQCTDNERWD